MNRCLVMLAAGLLLGVPACKKSDSTSSAKGSQEVAGAGSAAAGSDTAGSAAPAGGDTAGSAAPSGGDTAGSAGSAGSGSGSPGPAAGGGAKREVGPFTKVRVATAIVADIEIGGGGPLELTGEPDAIAAVITEVSNGLLDIHFPSGHTATMKQKLVVKVPTSKLSELEATTSATATVKNLACDRIAARAATAASIELHGRCELIDVTAASSAHVDASDLAVNDANVTASTAAEIRLDAAHEVTGKASTASKVHVSGKAAKNVKTETAAKVD